MITTISRAHLAFLFNEIEKLGISGGQFQFLVGLSKMDGITQEELANSFHMNQSTIARALRRLEDAGMVKRTVDKNNRRKNIITLTEKGRSAVENINKKDKKWEEKISSISSDEKAKLKDMLRALAVEAALSMESLKTEK